jgi:hypothetical protein
MGFNEKLIDDNKSIRNIVKLEDDKKHQAVDDVKLTRPPPQEKRVNKG